MHAERGKLLFRIKADKQPQRYLWLLGGVVLAGLWIYDAYRDRRLDFVRIVLPILYVGLFLQKFRRVTFYENGIHFPAETSGAPPRFISWGEIERFHWDGDMLSIVPGSSLLSGGGANAGAPKVPGSVTVPLARRTEVENLLTAATNVRIAG
jgi:hypothetical protein